MCTIFLSICIYFIYIFRATMCPSSEEITVSMRHLLFHSTLHTIQSSTQSDKYQVSHRYNYFSWWRAHSYPKQVQKRNKRTKKYCASSWLYLQDYRGMHGQQNIKFTCNPIFSVSIVSNFSHTRAQVTVSLAIFIVSVTKTGFAPSYFRFFHWYHPTSAPYSYFLHISAEAIRP